MNKTVLVVGSLNMDLTVKVNRLPDKGETIFGSDFATFPGGKGANQAVAAGKLGAKVYLAGCVGKDGFGRQLLDSLAGSGVNTSLVRSVQSTTGTALITVDQTGANTIVVAAGANGECSEDDVDRALAACGEPGVLLVQNEVPAPVVEYAIKMAKLGGWTVIYNPAPVRSLTPGIMKLIDILTPNETEMAILTGLPVSTPEEAETAAARLLTAGVAEVIVTLGDKGALHCNSLGSKHAKPYKVQAIDTTAAGDAYAGALATGLAEGKSLEDSMDFAAAVAALSVTKAGAQPSLPWRSEVEAFLERKQVGNC